MIKWLLNKLRERDAVTFHMDNGYMDAWHGMWFDCPKCEGVVNEINNYCPDCGRKVKWIY
jgi:hypothetical protein